MDGAKIVLMALDFQRTFYCRFYYSFSTVLLLSNNTTITRGEPVTTWNLDGSNEVVHETLDGYLHSRGISSEREKNDNEINKP